MKKILILLFGGILFVMLAAGHSAADSIRIPITYKGKAKAVIALGSEASLEDMQAAETLAVYLKKISGATIRILDDRNKPVRKKTTIFVGPNSYLTRKRIRVRSIAEDAFIVRTVGRKQIVLLGNGLRGTTYSVTAFLEELGCRWFMPGEMGEVVPSKRTLKFSKMNRLEEPDFRIRHFDGVGQIPALGKDDLDKFHTWMLRNRINRGYISGFSHYNFFKGPANHAYSKIIPAKQFDTMPELFPLINGKRRNRNQRCVSNPLALELGIQYVDRTFKENPLHDVVTLSPNDGGGWCQCDKCKAWDLPDKYIVGPYKKERSYSGRTFTFADLITQDMRNRHPEKQAVIYAYEKYSVPPTNFYPSDNLILQLTQNLHACDAHPIDSPRCKLNQWWRGQVVDGWADLTSNLWFYQYAYRWKACELPYPKWHSIGEDLKYLHNVGVWGYFAHGGFSNWGSNGLYYYVLSKLMWDVDADTDAIADDYCKKFYQSAAEPMKAYLYHMAEAFETQDAHLENISGVTLAFVEQMLSIYTPQILEQGSILLEEAMRNADTPLIENRVCFAEFTHRYTVLLLNLIRANLERKNNCTPENIQNTINAGEKVLELLDNEYIPWSITLKQSIYGAEETVYRILAEASAAHQEIQSKDAFMLSPATPMQPPSK